MNSTIDSQLSHRSIRAFTDEPVGEDVMDTLFEVGRKGASWSNYQQATVLRIKDPAIREAIRGFSTQPYVGGDRGELLVFVVDLSRSARIREEGGIDGDPTESISLFLAAAMDTMIAAQNMVVAAESLALGTVYLGSIGSHPQELISLLNLPKKTYPLVGLLIGHPDQSPMYKPRMPRTLTVAVDTYPEIPSVSEAMRDYDEELHTYYDLRNPKLPSARFTEIIQTKYGRGGSEVAPALEALHSQGLALR